MSSQSQLVTAKTNEVIDKSLLAKLPEQVRQSLVQDAVRLVLPAGTTLYSEQEEPRCGLVINGLIRVYMTSPDTREITVRYARVGEMLGIAAIVGGPAPVNVQILTETTLLMLNVRTLQLSGQSDAKVGWLLAQEVTQRLYETLEALAVNVFGSLRQRVALHLLDLAASRPQAGTLIVRVTQQELADAVGSVRPVIARVIRDFRTQGLITTSSQGIILLKPYELHMETWSHDV